MKVIYSYFTLVNTRFWFFSKSLFRSEKQLQRIIRPCVGILNVKEIGMALSCGLRQE